MQTIQGEFDGYKILEQVGSGFHGEVVVAEKQNKKYAVKLFKDKNGGIQNWKHEIEILKQLDHPNIVKLIQFKQKVNYKTQTLENVNRSAIVLEHIEGGELMYYLVVGRFSESAARTYFRIILNALGYMHQKGITHRDVKPQNILLDQKFDLKIIDFGFSTYLKRGLLKTRCGTQAYMAPEINQKGYEGKSSDLFAAGIILFLLFTGIPPFQKANEITDQYYKALYDKKYKKFWNGHCGRLPQGYLSDDFKDLIQKMLCHNPQQRLSLEQIMNHPWMKKDSMMLNEVYQQFTLRKKRIEQFRKMQIQYQHRRRKQMKKHQDQQRIQNKPIRSSCQLDYLQPYLYKIMIDSSEVQLSKSISQQDLIVNQSVQYFIAILQYNFQNKKSNLLVSNQQTQDITLQINNQTKQLKITVVTSFFESLQYQVAIIYLKLFKTVDKKLQVVFERDQQGDELLALKLVDFIKNGLYYSQQ